MLTPADRSYWLAAVANFSRQQKTSAALCIGVVPTTSSGSSSAPPDDRSG